MTEEEMRAYLSTRSSSLPLDDLVACSLGLPGLANELLDIPSLSLPIAQRLAALHLYHNGGRRSEEIPSLVDRYLHIPPNAAILEMLSKGMSTEGYAPNAHIYHHLPRLKKHYAYMQDGVSVYFVAPESVDMYTTELRKHMRGVHISMPWLSSEQAEVVGELLGFNSDNLRSRPTNRWFMFDASRKGVLIYGKLPNGNERAMSDCDMLSEWEYEQFRDRIRSYQRVHSLGLLTTPPISGQPYFSVSVNDHGGANEQPLHFGWMLESFLQQKGIGYIGHHSSGHFWYNPDEKRILSLEEGSWGSLSQKLFELRSRI